jgi:hypothetical protein
VRNLSTSDKLQMLLSSALRQMFRDQEEDFLYRIGIVTLSD